MLIRDDEGEDEEDPPFEVTFAIDSEFAVAVVLNVRLRGTVLAGA